ncbi:aerobic respiration two-component sensor histidine kinase ArcB [Bowmanella sp. Y26]|uniref:aerobic respiration two-component sensor histidine kinase ArcB n=1 Tax=Bowmanella yangjiangensis TaxID=2811230 RepID=UPI001BDD761B|nr:aerobic respiration two-component sensor histidine kinase ArcB [Bowmanella yangjiangensis]MBT1062019.1 aerobic respiration two-component sensor histidine kinase ArcB [Bowmanella yangjiangensis]
MQPSPSSQNESWAIRFAQFVDRFGTLRISILFVILTLIFTIAGSYFIRLYMTGEVHVEDFASAIMLTLLSAPWVLYFFSELVRQLEISRHNLKDVVAQLESLREEDVLLNRELQNNIRQLNIEIEERRKAQEDREKVFAELEQEIYEKSEKEQHALRLSSLLRSIIDASPDLIYFRNEEGRFAGCNTVAEQMTGKTEAELMGLTPHEVYDEDLANQVVASDHEVLENNVGITDELWLRFADGSKRYYEMRKVPFFDKEGNRLGLLAFGRDITERKHSQVALEKASRDKTAFIATISHELRTPLNGIVGLSRMLRDTKLTDEQYAWVSTIYASAITLGNIFNDIIDIDKLGRDKLELALKTVSLKDFFSELSSIIQLLVADKNLNFQTQMIEPLPDFVEADGTRLRQVLWNLLFNAVKFTQQGSVSFSLSAEAPKNGICNVVFKVADTGVGIPEEELPKIFAMYYQVKHPDHQSATGTGIGLAICKKMVELMDGDIRVTSEVGKGTCFTVELPLAISTRPAQLAELKITGLKILLVEDIELNVIVAKALLEKLGQTVEVAMTGRQALDMARANHYDLILLDIQLPDMNGFEVVSRMHEEELVVGTPVVALTANVIKTRQEYLDQGMDDVISKPIKKSRVVEVFNQLFCDASELPCLPETSTPAKSESVLDLDMLQMLVDTIGAEMLSTSVNVFNQSIPQYMEILLTNLSAKDKDEVCAQAHKIKGAAGSVGLSRVQKIANQIQQGDHPAWWQNVYDWVEELQDTLKLDIQSLNNWLSDQTIDD